MWTLIPKGDERPCVSLNHKIKLNSRLSKQIVQNIDGIQLWTTQFSQTLAFEFP